MLDFVMISSRILKSNKREYIEVYPIFKVDRVKDLMIRGGNFYAAWNEDKGLWTTDEFEVLKLIDREMDIYAKKHEGIKFRVFGSESAVLPLLDDYPCAKKAGIDG